MNIKIVKDWIAAINRRDRAGFLALSHEAIAFHGPAGVGIGHDVVADWFDTNRVAITARALTETAPDTVRVAHRIVWLDAEGAPEYEVDTAARITLRDGRIAAYGWIADPSEESAP